jgi:hypothetical protein
MNGITDEKDARDNSDGKAIGTSGGPIEMTADDLADDEWGSAKSKNKKDKKGISQKVNVGAGEGETLIVGKCYFFWWVSVYRSNSYD